MYNYQQIKDDTSKKDKFKKRLISTLILVIIILIMLGVLVCNKDDTVQDSSIRELQTNFNSAKETKAKYLVHEI